VKYINKANAARCSLVTFGQAVVMEFLLKVGLTDGTSKKMPAYD